MSQGSFGSQASSPPRPQATSNYDPMRQSGSHETLVDHVVQFCKENPGTAAAWCFGIGFVLGWRLKPW